MNNTTTPTNLGETLKHDTWVRPFFARYKKVLFYALALGVLDFIFAAGLMFTSGYLITGASVVETVLVLYIPLGFVEIFGFGKPFIHYFERLFSHDWVLRMTSGLRTQLYAALEKKTLGASPTRTSGEALGLLSQDIGHVQNFYLRCVFPTVVALVLYACLLSVLGFMSIALAACLLVSIATIIVVAPLVSLLACRATQAKVQSLKTELYTSLTDNVLGLADWIFSGRSEEYLRRHEEAQAHLQSEQAKLNNFDRIRTLVIQALYAVALVAMLVWAGLYFTGGYDANGMSACFIAAAVLVLTPLLDAFAPLSPAATEAQAHSESIAKLNSLGTPESLDAIEQQMASKPSPTPTSPAPASTVPESANAAITNAAITLNDVHFSYPDATQETLSELSLTIAPGETVAILGRSGAGKTTLANLIRGDLTPNSGTITVHSANPATFVNPAQHIGVIQQSPYLFNVSLFENVTLGIPNATHKQATSVLEQVGLKALCDRLPNGLDTVIDEAGMQFSGGERQRIALARILLQNAPIVILDEPANGLDPKTEQNLLDTLFDTLHGKTLLIITHHLLGIEAMDRVVFLENGTVTMQGAPATLAQTNHYFAELVRFDTGLY